MRRRVSVAIAASPRLQLGQQPMSRGNQRWTIAVPLTFMAALAALALWFGNGTAARNDPLFRGRPKSEWIKHLKYSDDEQVKEWLGYGEQGVQVLIRRLKKATHPRERAYRRINRLLPLA